MAENEVLDWDSDADGGVYLDKAALNDIGPQVTSIVGFCRMESWDTPDVLHVAFEQPQGWTKLTKPMQAALKKLYPGKAPNDLVGKPVMVMAQYTPAKGAFSEGYQIVISQPPKAGLPPQAPLVPPMPQKTAMNNVEEIPF